MEAASQHTEERLFSGQISVAKSRLYIFVDKTGFGHQHAVEGLFNSGHLHLDTTKDAGAFVFNMNSFNADTDAARRYLGSEVSTDSGTRKQVNANMKNASDLNVRQFPTATFSIDSATPMGRTKNNGIPVYELSGEFTLRGMKRPIRFSAEVDQKNGMTHIRGHFNILETQYRMTPFSKAFGAVGVTDQPTIHGELWVALEKTI